MREHEVREARRGGYHPRAVMDRSPELRAIYQLMRDGHFSCGDRDRYAPLVHSLFEHDEYMVLADYGSYVEAEARASHDYLDRSQWAKRSVRTVARMGYFSSDRSVREYCQRIWHVAPVPVSVPAPP